MKFVLYVYHFVVNWFPSLAFDFFVCRLCAPIRNALKCAESFGMATEFLATFDVILLYHGVYLSKCIYAYSWMGSRVYTAGSVCRNWRIRKIYKFVFIDAIVELNGIYKLIHMVSTVNRSMDGTKHLQTSECHEQND